jgi:hypothetical protein
LGLQAPEVSQATAHETTTTEGEQHHG